MERLEVGKMDQRIELRRPRELPKVSGQATRTKQSAVGCVWAEVECTGGNETNNETQLQSSRTYTIKIWADPRYDVRADWQIGWRGRDLNLTGVQGIIGKDLRLILTAIEQEASSK
ncbi:MAG: head-tail adaptor protein [Gemmataceae bacterium]